jgi:hypothetical protein
VGEKRPGALCVLTRRARLEEIDTNSGPNVEKLLVGNKCDLAERRVVTYDQGKQLADSIGCKFVEVCVQ